MGDAILYQAEPLEPLWPEVYPLLVEHWQEIAQFPDITLAPDVPLYKALDEAGMLRIYTARAAGKLIGYVAFIVRTHMHYRDSLQAQQDVLFLQAEHRRGLTGIRLLRFAEADLQQLGVQVVYQHVKTAHDFGPILERLGYGLVEKIYSKRLN